MIDAVNKAHVSKAKLRILGYREYKMHKKFEVTLISKLFNVPVVTSYCRPKSHMGISMATVQQHSGLCSTSYFTVPI